MQILFLADIKENGPTIMSAHFFNCINSLFHFNVNGTFLFNYESLDTIESISLHFVIINTFS